MLKTPEQIEALKNIREKVANGEFELAVSKYYVGDQCNCIMAYMAEATKSENLIQEMKKHNKLSIGQFSSFDLKPLCIMFGMATIEMQELQILNDQHATEDVVKYLDYLINQ